MRNLLLLAAVLLGAGAPGRAQELAPVDTLALRRENELVQRGVARRRADESDSAFVRRLFPASFYGMQFVRYGWRPAPFGPQLFFCCRARDAFYQEEEGSWLIVLDPYQPNTYAVQRLPLEPIGDITNAAALFFADVDPDGQKELLALVYAEVQHVGTLYEGPRDKGHQAYGRFTHWQTQVFRYAGLSRAGRPHYRRDTTPRPYLDGLSTAAAVRQALARHQARLQAPRPATAK